MSEPTIAIVTPWLDHPELADDYLAAVAVRRPDDQLLVIDNGSREPVPFAALRLGENVGFAKASNIGLQVATTDAVLFLNNDVVMTSPWWLEDIRAVLEPGCLVGTLRYDRHGDVDGQKLPYLDGWCLAGMRDDLLSLAGFDETFTEPAYYSDNDLCLRARASGMALRERRVGLEHLTSATTGPWDDPAKLAAVAANMPRYATRARQLLSLVPA